MLPNIRFSHTALYTHQMIANLIKSQKIQLVKVTIVQHTLMFSHAPFHAQTHNLRFLPGIQGLWYFTKFRAPDIGDIRLLLDRAPTLLGLGNVWWHLVSDNCKLLFPGGECVTLHQTLTSFCHISLFEKYLMQYHLYKFDLDGFTCSYIQPLWFLAWHHREP